MRPVFANSAFVRVRRGLVLRGGGLGPVDLRVRYGLFRHPQQGPVLIDTGYTLAVTEGPGRSLPLQLYARLLAPKLADQPVDFLARQGLRPADIRVVIVTHYHADHISGLPLFPGARVIGPGAALARVQNGSALGAMRHGVFPELIPADLARRLTPVESCPLAGTAPEGRDLFGDGSVLALDLPGHAEGHFGLWFAAEQLLYAVDAEWMRQALTPGCHPRFAGGLVSQDTGAAADSRRFVHQAGVRGAKIVLCHDPELTPYDEKVPL